MIKFNLSKWLTKDSAHALLKGVAWVSGFFALLLCLLLIVNFIQMKQVNPLDNPALQTLMHELEDDPQSETLKDQIRALDLLARKAYFTSQWQLRMGGLFLIVATGLLLGSLRLMSRIRATLPMPEGCADADDSWRVLGQSRKWIAVGGTLLLTTSLIAALISHGDIARIDFSAATTNAVEINQEEVWANFRGPGANGIAVVTEAPTEWDGESGQNIKWKVETPLPGFSSPVIWKDRLFLTGGDKNKREVYCYNTEDGSLMWQAEADDIPGSPANVPRVHSDTGLAPSTVAVDGAHVCAIFPTGDLICLDFDGNRIWAQNLGVPDNHYGHSSSLLIHNNLLIVQYDQNANARLLALDVNSGETAWRVNRPIISWSSPILVNTGQRDELILTNSASVDSYDPMNGVLRWGFECLDGEMGPSAAYANGMVFATNDYATTVGIKITATGAEIVWEYDENLPDTASPLATDEYLFLACSYGYIVCVDAKTGEMVWEQEFDDGFYASPILVGNLIYATDLQGVTHIFEASGEYKQISAPALGETSACTPAFVGNRIYHRGEKSLFCIEAN